MTVPTLISTTVSLRKQLWWFEFKVIRTRFRFIIKARFSGGTRMVIRVRADHGGDHVTPDRFTAGSAELDALIPNTETQLRMLGIAGLMLAVLLRLLG